MSDTSAKVNLPAYTTFAPLITFLNKFREEKIVPLQVDKSHMRTSSGSTQNSHLQSLKYLKLIDANAKPTPLFKEFVMASDEERKPILKRMLEDTYDFLLDPLGATDFDIERASGQMVEDKFKGLGVGGSTVHKCMSFFLAAAKTAGIKVSSSVKLPALPGRSGPKKAKKEPAPSAATNQVDSDDDEDEDQAAPSDMKFIIPIPIDRKVKISIPKDFTTADWTLLKTMFDAYVTRWQAMDLAEETKGSNQKID